MSTSLHVSHLPLSSDVVYRIAQGTNVVTGYRRGTRASVTYEVERIVEAFNDRLMVRPRVNRWTGKAVAPSPRRS